ncbi:LytTR family DNA-binding domain-containing protein [Aliikangiella sp. G2MR2-5]|uniref:LytR/AlgR family response regulator transcription factor n=1 Tax=Aliikangiella sp. G2MR2-5 TaxID=2788943 RepID=UPI0018A9F0DB|nr:LytTR family DNA-binding domain-containing protein [Aliikangiella sp. G2MR2-5]
MKFLIVDDEPLAQQRLKQLVEKLPQTGQVYLASNGLQAIELCQQEKPDLVLMDIRMPGIDGLEAAQHISQMEKAPAIIFITAYDEYALDAFKVHAVDYLLKPVREEKLAEAVERACQLNRAQLNAIKSKPDARANITAKISGNIKLIPIEDVIFFQAEQKYVTVKYLDGETIIEDTLKELQAEFDQSFVRVHRNALVAVRYITGIHKSNDGKSFVTLADCDKELEISRRHLSAVKKLISKL